VVPQDSRARHLFIVSREHRWWYDYLADRFGGDPNVRVILDRRIGERRRDARSVDAERRRAERRLRPHVDGELQGQAYVIVDLD